MTPADGLNFDRLDAALAGWIDDGVLPCLSVQVARRGLPVHAFRRGAADLETGRPVEADTIFAVYSMSKPVTAAAMMVLYDRGLWRPDDRLADHLPEFEGVTAPGEDGAPVAPTVEHLMLHTAGLGYGLPFGEPDAVDQAYLAADVWGAADLRDFSERVASCALAFAPGSTWRYSLAMDLQGALVERLTGRAFRDFVREEVCAPLGMTDTDFSVPPEKRARLAKVYSGLFGPDLQEFVVPPFDRRGEAKRIASGGGGMYSTVEDYGRFAAMLLRRGAYAGGRIMSEEAAALMMSNHVPERMMQARLGSGPQQMKPGFGRGYNGSVFVDPAAAGSRVGRGTYQWDGASSVWFWVDPVADLSFVAMTNRMMEDALPRFQEQTQALVADALEVAR